MFLLAEYPYLALAQTAFMIWMLVDAYTRRADSIWFLVILFVPGLGAWAYFFVVKARDFRRVSLPTLFHRRSSLEELRYRADQVPTLASHLELAERLIEKRWYDEAIPHLEDARKREPQHSQVLYLLAQSYAAEGKPETALPLLQELIQHEPRWSNYAAWHLLVETRAKAGDHVGALASCRELVKLAPTLHHSCLLAECLLDNGHHDEARGLLDRSLQDYRFAPGPSRRLNRVWLRLAKRLRRQATAAP
jgi:predicted Zn-dependent protease